MTYERLVSDILNDITLSDLHSNPGWVLSVIKKAAEELSFRPEAGTTLPKWAGDLELAWAEWSGGHLTDFQFTQAAARIVCEHILRAGYGRKPQKG